MKPALVALASLALLAGCTPTVSPRCEGFTFTHAGGANNHVASCGDPTCGNGLNPPTAGPHCGTTTTCSVHATEVPRCSWIHNLEHGHAVLAYNCPEGCPDIVSGLQAVFAAQSLPRRVVVTPDPLLPNKVAAIVWGYSYVSDTFDRDAIECLLEEHQDQEAPEAGLSCAQ